MSSTSRQWGIAIVLVGLLAWASPGFARVPGTRPAGASLSRAAKAIAASNSLRPIVTETGRIGVSMDGSGTVAESSYVEIEKATGATVRRAFLAAASAGFSGHRIADGEISLDGVGVPWDSEVPTVFDSYNHFAEVTSLVSAKLDAAAAGRVPFEIREAFPTDVDGVALLVIFDEGAPTPERTVAVLFGAQNPAGDHFSLGFANPINTGDPGLQLDLSLGISFGFQSAAVTDQFSMIDVNGSRLSSSAGGQDDGAADSGALFTIGGIDDSSANPDPLSPPLDYDTDDERYDLVPFLKDGDTRLLVETANPSDDDNIFLACVSTSEALQAQEALILTPSTSTGEIGTAHTVTASFENAQGDPSAGADVLFDVFAGPHAGASGAGTTDGDGRATFTYPGSMAGTDSIRATAPGSSGDVVSNTAVRVWTTGGGTDDVTLTLAPTSSSGPIGALHVLTATLQNSGAAEPGRRLMLEVFAGPNVGYRDSTDTNANGVGTFAYTSNDVGLDSLIARTVPGGTSFPTVPSNVATRAWTGNGGGQDTLALSLTPISSTGPVGASHTVTGALTLNGAPLGGQPVAFSVYAGPDAGTVATETTDAGGQATFTYFGMSAGVDSILATATISGSTVSSNTATMLWTGGGAQAYDVSLAPPSAIRLIGTPHTVVATVRANGVGVAGARVEFAILGGPHVGASGVDTTDTTGSASFTYAGAIAGVDTLRAAAMIEGQSIPSNTVTITWFDDENPTGGTVLGMDIKPTSCVNPINTGGMGVIPVALLGSLEVDVRDVDASSLRLEGVPPLRRQYGDVSQPGPSVACGCSSEGADGYRDLNLKFDSQEFVAALGPVTDGEIRTVTLTGEFKDGSPLVATDCIRIIDNSGGNGGGNGLDADNEAAPRFALDPVTPNPFNPAASISYRVPSDGHVRLVVYDVRGRIVATLVDGYQSAGEHTTAWSPGPLASGVYFTRLESAGRWTVRRAVLAK